LGAVEATITAATTTSITATVPAGATYFPITVTQGGLTAYSQMPFIVTFNSNHVIDPGLFSSKVDFAAGSEPFGASVGDVDGDGKPDIQAANINAVSVFKNKVVSAPPGSSLATRASEESLPKKFSLKQNYPNPFNPTTNIVYALSEDAFVRLSVYDLLGQEVKTPVNENEAVGQRNAMLDASNIPSGVYFYHLTAVSNSGKNFTMTNKMVLMK
jgi:hypothetical protein